MELIGFLPHDTISPKTVVIYSSSTNILIPQSKVLKSAFTTTLNYSYVNDSTQKVILPMEHKCPHCGKKFKLKEPTPLPPFKENYWGSKVQGPEDIQRLIASNKRKISQLKPSPQQKSPPISVYLQYHVITKRAFTLIEAFHQKGYNHNQIQIDQDTQRVQLHANNSGLGYKERIISFPEDLDTSYLKLPQLCKDYIDYTEKTDTWPDWD